MLIVLVEIQVLIVLVPKLLDVTLFVIVTLIPRVLVLSNQDGVEKIAHRFDGMINFF